MKSNISKLKNEKLINILNQLKNSSFQKEIFKNCKKYLYSIKQIYNPFGHFDYIFLNFFISF